MYVIVCVLHECFSFGAHAYLCLIVCVVINAYVCVSVLCVVVVGLCVFVCLYVHCCQCL